jgi:hypothetical protein
LNWKPIACEQWKKFATRLPPLHTVEGPWVAGGAARRLWGSWESCHWTGADIDVFFASELQFKNWQTQFLKEFKIDTGQARDDLLEFSMNYKAIGTPNAETYCVDFEGKAVQVQLIKKAFYPTLELVWNSFDFDICCFAADKSHACARSSALHALRSRTIDVNNPDVKHNLTLRLLKHVIHGYQPSNALILEAVDKIVSGEIDWHTPY